MSEARDLDTSARIAASVDARRGELIEILRALVEAESPSSHPHAHAPVRALLADALSGTGLAVREVGRGDGPRHLFARPRRHRRHAPRQLLLGHFDTVWPLGTVATRPFSIDGEVARGPGVFDMKAGLVQIVIALRCLRDLGIEPGIVPLVFLNADEEIGSRSSTRWIRMLARRCERAFVLEPAMGDTGFIKTERKGVGRFTITVAGRAAHAGLAPDQGASAILELSHVIQRLFALNDFERGISVNVGTIDGGIQPNVIAPHSRAVVDVRVPTVADGEAITRAIHAIEPSTPGVRLEIEGGIGRPSLEATPRNRALWEQARALGHEIGLDLRGARAGGGSDGNTTSQYTATLDGLGPVGDGAHAEHEFVDIGRTLERTALLALLLASPSIPTGTAP